MEETKKEKGTLIKVIPIKRKITGDISFDSVLIWYRDENRSQENKICR